MLSMFIVGCLFLLILALIGQAVKMILPPLLKAFVICFCVFVILAALIVASSPKTATPPTEIQNADGSVSINLN